MAISRKDFEAAGAVLIVPAVLGAVVPIAMTRGLGDLDFGPSLAVAFVLFFVPAVLVAWTFTLSRVLVGIAMFCGIAAGVVIDIIADGVFFRRSRNLFPFEVAYWWVIGVLPIALGALFGGMLHRRRTHGGGT